MILVYFVRNLILLRKIFIQIALIDVHHFDMDFISFRTILLAKFITAERILIAVFALMTVGLIKQLIFQFHVTNVSSKVEGLMILIFN